MATDLQVGPYLIIEHFNNPQQTAPVFFPSLLPPLLLLESIFSAGESSAPFPSECEENFNGNFSFQ